MTPEQIREEITRHEIEANQAVKSDRYKIQLRSLIRLGEDRLPGIDIVELVAERGAILRASLPFTQTGVKNAIDIAIFLAERDKYLES